MTVVSGQLPVVSERTGAKLISGRIFIWLLATVLLTTVSFAEGQQPGKIRRIGYLDESTAASSAELLEAFRQEMNRFGWTDRKNITIEYRFSEGKPGKLPELAAELVRLKMDVIVTVATNATLAAKQATTAIPIVMASGGDPVGAGLIATMARPGGNVTGLTTINVELGGKRLELLKDVVPKLIRIGVLRGPGRGVGGEQQMKELKAAAPALELTLQEIKTELGPKDLEIAFQTAAQERVNGIITLSGARFFGERKRIVDTASKYRLPAIYPRREFAEAGGLMAYGGSFTEQYRRAAYYVDRILKGTKPADLPVEQPTKFDLVINLKTAKQIDATIPPNVLARADKVIR